MKAAGRLSLVFSPAISFCVSHKHRKFRFLYRGTQKACAHGSRLRYIQGDESEGIDRQETPLKERERAQYTEQSRKKIKRHALLSSQHPPTRKQTRSPAFLPLTYSLTLTRLSSSSAHLRPQDRRA